MELKVVILQLFFIGIVRSLELRNGAYEELVIKVADNVPEDDCREVLDNLERTLTSASQYLFSALDSRAYLKSVTVLLPATWSDSCSPKEVLAGSGEVSDITVLPSDPIRGPLYTQQSLGCGQPGDQIYLSHETLLESSATLPRNLIKEFAMYRYGVFEEQGYFNDPVYPMCFYDDQTHKVRVTGCSDLHITDNGICTTSVDFNVTEMVDPDARSSIMFAAEAPNVNMFCDDGNHDRYAPTKHNLICQRRSVLDVVLKHRDFDGGSQSGFGSEILDTKPLITYKRQNLTRYVFVVENNKDMLQRESWAYLRLAMRFWAKYVVPDNTELGLVLSTANPTKTFKIVSVKNDVIDRFGTSKRDNFYSALPYTPSDSMQSGCLHCSLKVAMDMLVDRTRTHGNANNVIVVIAPGMTLTDQIRNIADDLKRSSIKVATINYPNIARPDTLRYLALATQGKDYTVFERKLNVDTTMLTTYFDLHNALYNIVFDFYSGSISDLPMEIHRREITDKTGRPLVSGTFIIDDSYTEPAQFTFFTYNNYAPLFKGLKLTSPSNHVYDTRTDKFIDFKMITLNANLSEVGTWTYNVEPYAGNPQPHYLQVMATPASNLMPVVRTSFKIHQQEDGLYVLLATATYGDLPILGAKVEVTITNPGVNDTTPQKQIVYLMDSGSGDPDITKGDGVYTRYFSPEEQGLYTFQPMITNNDNTAYTWSVKLPEDKPCCGSSIKSNGAQQISPFQRSLPQQTLMVNVVTQPSDVGRIGDLRVDINPEEQKAKLTWTAPDMAGSRVTKYEIKYAFNVMDILDKFETGCIAWDTNNGPYPMDPGSETSYILDFSNKDFQDKPLYFAIKAYKGLTGPQSNYVRVLVPSPPPPPTVPPTLSPNDSIWPNHVNTAGLDPSAPSKAKTMGIGMDIILPVVIGIILLIILLTMYCYFCVLRKKPSNNKTIKKDNLSSTITIVPSSPQHQPSPPADPHQVGVPVSNYAYEDETKKRYSLVNQQEQQLIEELKQHQQPPAYSGISVITNQQVRNGQPLSPYNSWSASQLLHEHERRYSPMDDEQLIHQEVLAQMDHMSLQNQDQMVDPYAPPVPPLPQFSYPSNYSIYGVHPHQNQIYEQFNGSVTSVNSGEKKRRNVTMV